MKRLTLILSFALSINAFAQQSPDIKTVKLYKMGDQTSFPFIVLNTGDQMELDFDDLSNRIKNYYYTYELCNADWTPSILKPFEYIKGFDNVRISNYRNSSISLTRYIHYQAAVPDRNCYPSRSGNYLLKVYLDNDTSRVVFVKRFVVLSRQSAVAAEVRQPLRNVLFNTAQKLYITVQTNPGIQPMSPNDVKVVVLQNNNWETSKMLDRPTIYRGNYYEYSDEETTYMPGGKEFRWIDLRSLRLLSDRMKYMETKRDTTNVYVKPDPVRTNMPYIYYRDLDGSYTIGALEDINPFWQGDYAYVHFSFFPPANKPIVGSDVYLFGELTNYGRDTSGKMTFDPDKGAYEKTLLLKQGYYNYMYVTKPINGNAMPDLSQTEGNYWGTENSYIVLVYYRSFGSRADEVIGFTALNSIFQGPGN